MNSLEQVLEWIIPDDIHGTVISEEYRTTKSGRRIHFFTTQVVWYALRVYFADENRPGHGKLFARTEHLTLSGVREQIEKYINEL